MMKIIHLLQRWIHSLFVKEQPSQEEEHIAVTREMHSLSIEERIAIAEQARQERIKELQAKEPDIIPASDDAKCGECGKSNVEMLTCSVCGKHVCGDCAIETFSGKVYCDSCFSEEPSHQEG